MFSAGRARALVAGAAGCCLLAASVVLVVRSSGEGRATLTTYGSQSDTAKPDTRGDGWEDNRPTWTSPDNERPETPPGHDKPTSTTRPPRDDDNDDDDDPPRTTTTRPKPTTTTRPTTSTSTTTSTTVYVPDPACGTPPAVVTRPSEYVPPCTVLEIFPAYGYIGPLATNDPNLRPFDYPIREHGATRGYARTWLATPVAGGYTVYAWEFADNAHARAARDAGYGRFWDDFGADEFPIRDGVEAALVMGDTARAYWVQGNYLRIVDLSTQFNRQTNPWVARDDMRTIVNRLIALDPRGCC